MRFRRSTILRRRFYLEKSFIYLFISVMKRRIKLLFISPTLATAVSGPWLPYSLREFGCVPYTHGTLGGGVRRTVSDPGSHEEEVDF